jgi:hypothetical protein
MIDGRMMKTKIVLPSIILILSAEFSSIRSFLFYGNVRIWWRRGCRGGVLTTFESGHHRFSISLQAIWG